MQDESVEGEMGVLGEALRPPDRYSQREAGEEQDGCCSSVYLQSQYQSVAGAVCIPSAIPAATAFPTSAIGRE